MATSELPRSAAAGKAARDFVRQAMASYPEDRRDTAELLVDELANNAVEHGSGAIRLSVELRGGRVRVSVSDEGEGLPQILRPNATEAHGRGLALISELADSWGILARAPSGKAVWFEV